MLTSRTTPSITEIGSSPTGAKSPNAMVVPSERRVSPEALIIKRFTPGDMVAIERRPTTSTVALATSGFQITLKSRQGPCGSTPFIGSSPLNATGESSSAARKLRSGRTSCIPSPSITVRIRRMPGNTENGPSDATSAIDSRQTTLPSASFRRSSRVTPPPFFHGVATRSVKRKIFTTGTPLSPLDLQRATKTSNGAQ